MRSNPSDKAFKQKEKHKAKIKQLEQELSRATKDCSITKDQLYKIKERYALATGAASVGVWDLDLQSNEFYLDPNVKAILGYSDAEIPNDINIWANFVHPDDRQPVMDAFQDHIDGKIPEYSFEHRMLHKNGSVRWIFVRGTAIRDENGTAIRVVGTDTDITTRKKAEIENERLQVQLQRAQKMEAIGTLAGGIAHDINNLLMAIQGNVSLMLFDIKEDHPHYSLLKKIEKSIEKGSSLTKQLLGYARKGKYQVSSINLNNLVKEALQTIRRTRKDVTVEYDLSPELLPVEADKGQIQQVLYNIFINALESMPDGGKICVTTANISREKMKNVMPDLTISEYIQIAVADDGIGMDKEILKRVFDPFFTTKNITDATGLGMASAYGIVRNHGGHLDVQSEKDVGSTFYIYLPALRKKTAATHEIDKQGIKKPETILIVDDEDYVLEPCSQMLKRLGYTVATARSGNEAIEIYKKDNDKIDIVILDIIMPEMGGEETFDILKQINPNVKVLLSTGYGIEGRAKAIIDKGACSILRKPFSIENLSNKIKEILS